MSNFVPPSKSAVLKCCWDPRDSLTVTRTDDGAVIAFERTEGLGGPCFIRVKAADVAALGEYLSDLAEDIFREKNNSAF